MTLQAKLMWIVVAALGAVSFAVVALTRGEPVNAAWLVVAAVCIYFIAYRFYGLFITDKVFGIDAKRQTPAYRHNDGLDYVPTNKYVLFGHHFAAIAGAGPLVGPVLAAQMGYLPGTFWILAGVVFAGAVQDMTVLFLSTRRDGRSLGDMIRAEMGPVAGGDRRHRRAADLRHRPRRARPGRGQGADGQPVGHLHGVLHHSDRADHGRLQPLHPARAASARCRPSAPCCCWRRWSTAAPSPRRRRWRRYFNLQRRDAGADYHRLWLRRLGAAGLAAAGAARLSVDVPEDRHHRAAGDRDHHGSSGSADAGDDTVHRRQRARCGRAALFPFLFITIACGAVSGWHALIASGTTPKMIENESQIRFIGYGAMLMESLVAIMAMIARLGDPSRRLLRDEQRGGRDRHRPRHAAQVISAWGFVGHARDADPGGAQRG